MGIENSQPDAPYTHAVIGVVNGLSSDDRAGGAGGYEPPAFDRDAFGRNRAAWSANAENLRGWARRRLVNRDDAFVHYLPIKRRRPGKPFSFTAKIAATAKPGWFDTVLLRHFAAADHGNVIALHTTKADVPGGEGEIAACWSLWGVIDYDCHGEDGDDPDANFRAALAAYDRAVSLGFEALLIDSNGAGGFHLWVLFAGPVPTWKVRSFMHWLGRGWEEFGFKQEPEVFPKQDSIDPGKFGNVVRLPGLHHTRGHFSRVWDGNGWLDGAEAIRAILATTGTPANAIPGEALAPAEAAKKAMAEKPAKRKRYSDNSQDDAALAEDALDYLGCGYVDDYDRWIEIGQCLYQLGNEGLGIWDEWSRGDTSYETGACSDKWATFSTGDRTLGSLFYYASQNGWPGPQRKRDDAEPQGEPAEFAEGFSERCLKASVETEWVPARIVPAPEGAEAKPRREPDLNPTKLNRKFRRAILSGKASIILAPTGSGKTYSLVQLAVLLALEGIPVAICVPTAQIADEIGKTAARMSPELFARDGAVVSLFDREKDDSPVSSKLGSKVRLLIFSHEQLRRRGFSRFFREARELLGPVTDDDGSRPAFHVIVDELDKFTAGNDQTIATAIRHKERLDGDRRSGQRIAQTQCMVGNHSDTCTSCKLHQGGGEVLYTPTFKLNQLVENRGIRFKVVGKGRNKDCSEPVNPLDIQQGDFTTGPERYVGKGTWAARILAFHGKPVGTRAGREAQEFETFHPEEDGTHPYEHPRSVVEHILIGSHNPVLITRRPYVRATEEPVESRVLAEMFEAAKGKDKAAKRAQEFLDGIVFPVYTCETPTIQASDMGALEFLRRLNRDHGIGVLYVGATMSKAALSAYRAAFPDIEVHEEEYGDGKIRQACVGFVGDGAKDYVGSGKLVDKGVLRTKPLEDIKGMGLVFEADSKNATKLYNTVAAIHTSATIFNQNTLWGLGRHGTAMGVEPRTIITYPRSSLGSGVNLENVRHITIDSLAIRSTGSFNPDELSPEAYQEYVADDRRAQVMQALGRGLRGDVGNTLFVLILNADEALRDAIREARSLHEGCELPPVFVEGHDISQVVDQAKRWLESGGGEWPGADPSKVGAKPKGRKADPGKREAILEEAEEAMIHRERWSNFAERTNAKRYLGKDEIADLKGRFKARINEVDLSEVPF